ncbi:MAG: PilZ domain-containing protein [Oscillospiraceae bacterium]|nr:PilZ domain-containing protein [Oscillospiraceae bacterium]
MLDKDKVIKLEVCTLRGHVLLTVSKGFLFPRSIVKDESEDKDHQVAMIKGKNLPVFARGAPINTVAYTRAGDRFNFPGYIMLSTEYQLNVNLRSTAAEKLPDRRRYYKIAAEIPGSLTSITRQEKYIAIEPSVPVVIQDINIGGIFLGACEELELNLDDIISVVLTDVSGETELVSKVLRIKSSPEGDIEGYGCCFVYLNTRQEEVIARFIHMQQIKQRAKEREENENDDAV